MTEQAPVPNPDEMMQGAAEAARDMVESVKPPKSEQEIADQVGRITWKLGERIDNVSGEERQPDRRRGTAFSKPINVSLEDGGKIESHLQLGLRNVKYSDAKSNEIHKTGAMWAHGPGRVQRHTDVGTESRQASGYSTMGARDESKLGEEPKILMDISDDPRPWAEQFKPPTEEVRRQAISNAAGSLSKIRGAVAKAETEKRARSTEKPKDEAA